jgi:hypothetical protein
MEGIGRACLDCQAELGPNTRFCMRCGRPAGTAEPGAPVSGAPWPGGPVPGVPGPGPGDGPGFTVVTPPAPAQPSPGWGSPAAAGWAESTVTQPAVPPPSWQAALPPAARPQPPAYPPQPALAPSYPPVAYEPPASQPGPAGPRGFEPFLPYQSAAPTAGPPPLGPPSGPLPGPPRQPPRRHDRDRSGTPLTVWIILLVVLLGGGAAAALLVTHPFRHRALSETASTRPTAATSASAGPAAAPGAASPAATERQAATHVATMLAQSVSDRAAITSAAGDVGSCGANLAAAPKVFDDAASSRQSLLASLSAVGGRAALPPALVSDLTQAWQASIAADQAYAKWANDEITQGCVKDDTNDPGYRATITPNLNATKYKTAFVAQWNPVAAKYGLKQYQPGQL